MRKITFHTNSMLCFLIKIITWFAKPLESNGLKLHAYILYSAPILLNIRVHGLGTAGLDNIFLSFILSE